MRQTNMEARTITYKGKIVFEKIRLKAFARMPKLYKDNEACFMFLEEGAFSVRMPDKHFTLNKGKAFLAKCFDYFFETSDTQRKKHKEIEVIGVLLHQSIIEEVFQFDINDYPHNLDYNAKLMAVDELLENFKKSINILLENPSLADEEMIKTKLKEFILLLSKKEKAPTQLHFLASLYSINNTAFKTTISQNIFSSLSISEFAKLCALSHSSFKRKFKEVYHESPATYIMKQKLLKAKSLLIDKNISISEVAFKCGFESQATFNRNFKSFYKISPSAYRKEQI